VANHLIQRFDPPPSKGFLLAAGGLFALVALSGLAGIAAAAIPMPKSAWTLCGFEVVVTVSAVLGLIFVRSGSRDAAAIGLATLAFCVGAASFLGYFSVQKSLGGVNLAPFLAFRCLTSASLGGLALIAAMRGDLRAWTTLFKGIAVGIPAALGLALFVLPAGKRVLDAVSGLGGFAAFVVGTLAFLAFTASAAAGIHLVIRSFQTAGKTPEGGGSAR
jgi:hypothetical protein